MRPGHIDIPTDIIAAICRKYQIKELAIFGSAVRDDFRDDSDVDVLVEFEPEAQIGFLALARLQRELSAIVKRPVDVVPKNGLKPHIRQSVLASAQVLYAA
ncbi:MAG TPA: nucleotidyltransferase domain-containing protein [Roseiflexaceae bacterium]|jgi:predicted nucleotidyltransferase|nr:nucleotidyltransferase domain-containing protein [Roseiflexaceae bacterium]